MSMMTPPKKIKFTIPRLLESKGAGSPVAMVTAYDATMARIVDAANVDLILVGDSVGTVMQGAKNTLAVTMDQMAYHVQMVAAAKPSALIVGDLPFGSYQASNSDAVRNSIRLIQAGAECVKLEGGVHVSHAIEAIVNADIPVIGHIGLTPQSYHRMGGNKVQGRTEGDGAGSRERIMKDALAVEKAGASAVVIEAVPSDLAEEITNTLAIPTIGIGAGVHCDGQVLVINDLLGLSERCFTFTKAYTNFRQQAIDAVNAYVNEVHESKFPSTQHSFQ